MGESATLQRETGHQTLGRKGRKASAPSQTESHVEQVAMDNESEVAYVRAVMENLPTLAKKACLWTGGRPQNEEGFRAIHITRCMVSTRKKARCKAHILRSRKMNTRNGVTRQWLSDFVGAGDQAVSAVGRDGPRLVLSEAEGDT